MIYIEKPSEEKLNKLNVKLWPVWEKEVSEFPWEYNEKETCYIIEGEVMVTSDDGESAKIGKGDLVVFPEGLTCRWKITKPLRKHFRFG